MVPPRTIGGTEPAQRHRQPLLEFHEQLLEAGEVERLVPSDRAWSDRVTSIRSPWRRRRRGQAHRGRIVAPAGAVAWG